MKSRIVQTDRFHEVIDAIAREYPNLEVRVDLNHEHVHASMDIPAQDGLDFDIHIDLQNCDELHLGVGEFWCEWFPCDDQEIADRFIQTVLGVISGRYRVLERWIGKQTTSAIIQRPVELDSWKTVATTINGFWWLVPWPRSRQVIQNRSSAGANT